jgi:two-component system, chemotaxis family, protein-glutamate methylesterase/glutaminase
MRKIRVLIVDDSPTYRAILRDMLERSGDVEVVGEARNGEQAIGMATDLRPNLITMDLEMPGGGGLPAIERIMTTKAVPILVVSAASNQPLAYEALSRGALDVVAKPKPAQAAEFVAKVRMLAGVPVITRIYPGTAAAAVPPPTETPLRAARHRIFVVAASTGGPQALAYILAALPADFPAPILVAQHISDGFALGMAQWLDNLCRIQVVMATAGEIPKPALAYLSPSEASLYLDPQGRMMLAPRGEADLYRPRCDALLSSAAVAAGSRAVGIILTGMGHDGVEGMARIRAAGGATIGQDEQSSTIFGMNREAIEHGHVATVLPLDRIAERMMALAGTPFAGSAA